MVIKLKITKHVDKPKPKPTRLIVERVTSKMLAAKKAVTKRVVRVEKKAKAVAKKVAKKASPVKKSVAKKVAPVVKVAAKKMVVAKKAIKAAPKKAARIVKNAEKVAEKIVHEAVALAEEAVAVDLPQSKREGKKPMLKKDAHKFDAGVALPDFAMVSTAGGTMSKEQLLGSRYVLYFYPKDMTPGCTTEAHEFSALAARFEGEGVKLFGVSPDSLASHEEFVRKENIRFPLLVDEGHKLAETLGVWGGTHNKRTTFVVGADGLIERAYHNVEPKDHGVCVLTDLLK